MPEAPCQSLFLPFSKTSPFCVIRNCELRSVGSSMYHHHSTSFLTGGLVSKAWNRSSKIGWNCITPTRPYKSLIRHCPFSKSRSRFWLFSSSESTPKKARVFLISLMSVERNANFKPRLFFSFSSSKSSVFWVTK